MKTSGMSVWTRASPLLLLWFCSSGPSGPDHSHACHWATLTIGERSFSLIVTKIKLEVKGVKL